MDRHLDHRALRLKVKPFWPLPTSTRRAISDEAERIAPFRGADRAETSIVD